MGTAVSSCCVMWEISNELAFYHVHLHLMLHACWVIYICRFLDWLKVTEMDPAAERSTEQCVQ
jgi:hypothetical protein